LRGILYVFNADFYFILQKRRITDPALTALFKIEQAAHQVKIRCAPP
jgi:hypothetical protein